MGGMGGNGAAVSWFRLTFSSGACVWGATGNREEVAWVETGPLSLIKSCLLVTQVPTGGWKRGRCLLSWAAQSGTHWHAGFKKNALCINETGVHV